MIIDKITIGKMLASAGATITALGIALPLSSNLKELITATGVFVTALSAYIAHVELKNGKS